MQLFNYRLLIIIILAAGFVTSCKKNDSISAENKLKDSVLLYSRDIYLWYNQIPKDFNPRNYSDPDAIMKAIRAYSIEPPNAGPVDRFSFAALKKDWDNLSSGISADFGLDIFFFTATDLRVKYVERESAAGKAGIKRGWRITKINGSSNISTDQATLNTIVKAVFESATTSFTFLKPDGTSIDITLNASAYQTFPVMVDSVYTVGTKKIGYLVLNSFLGDTVNINSEFNRVFTRFTSAGIDDVVIDLRYNGGGYVSLAEKLSNYLAPSPVNGSLMMMQKYNDRYSQYNTSVNFNKAGTLNLPRIIFIVSSSSASASELVINNLMAVTNVKLIGKENTYGKPVGFFPIPVENWYIFPVSFRTVNRNGKSDYFSGFTPDAIVADGLDKNWGDVTEASLASAIKYITTGSFRLQQEATYQPVTGIIKSNATLDAQNFKGTIIPTKIFK